MKNIKNFTLGIIVGLSIISAGVFASTTQSGKIGSLFTDIGGGNYRLIGDFIKDGTIGTDEIANSAITSSKINDHTITDSDINISKVQKRVSGTCPSGQTIKVIKEDGTVECGISSDNLGNHTATSDLDMNGKKIKGLTLAGGIEGNNFDIIGANKIKFNDPGEGINFTDKAWIYAIDARNKDEIKIDANKVGIGTNTPYEKLDVNGNIKSNSNKIYYNGTYYAGKLEGYSYYYHSRWGGSGRRYYIGLKTNSGEWGVQSKSNGPTYLYYDGTSKLYTASNGVNINGNLNISEGALTNNSVTKDDIKEGAITSDITEWTNKTTICNGKACVAYCLDSSNGIVGMKWLNKNNNYSECWNSEGGNKVKVIIYNK